MQLCVGACFADCAEVYNELVPPLSPSLCACGHRAHFVTASVRNKVSQAADTASEPRHTITRGLDDALAPAVGRDQFRPLGGTVIGDRCYATVLLDEELWRWLAALDPAHDVAWVHGCELEHGHRGDHHALVY